MYVEYGEYFKNSSTVFNLPKSPHQNIQSNKLAKHKSSWIPLTRKLGEERAPWSTKYKETGKPPAVPGTAWLCVQGKEGARDRAKGRLRASSSPQGWQVFPAHGQPAWVGRGLGVEGASPNPTAVMKPTRPLWTWDWSARPPFQDRVPHWEETAQAGGVMREEWNCLDKTGEGDRAREPQKPSCHILTLHANIRMGDTKELESHPGPAFL